MDTQTKANENLTKVKAMLGKQLGKKQDDIKPESRIIEDLGADSLDIVEMLMSLEETYGITIPDDDAMALKTVAELVAYLDKNIQ
jgi:acyl carrier protein